FSIIFVNDLTSNISKKKFLYKSLSKNSKCCGIFDKIVGTPQLKLSKSVFGNPSDKDADITTSDAFKYASALEALPLNLIFSSCLIASSHCLYNSPSPTNIKYKSFLFLLFLKALIIVKGSFLVDK